MMAGVTTVAATGGMPRDGSRTVWFGFGALDVWVYVGSDPLTFFFWSFGPGVSWSRGPSAPPRGLSRASRASTAQAKPCKLASQHMNPTKPSTRALCLQKGGLAPPNPPNLGYFQKHMNLCQTHRAEAFGYFQQHTDLHLRALRLQYAGLPP